MSAKPVTRDEADALLAPLRRFSRVALAVSGGPDSLALMHLAAQVNAGPALTVLTVDHGLRAGSREEALIVARAAEAARLPHALLTWEHDGASVPNLQARARAARYGLMASYCHAHGIEALVTAHHLDDQAETFLMRLKRGSGLDGLTAIPEEGAWAGLTLLRPLLDMPKARLVATVEAAGLAYAVDPSNADARFERARLRQQTEALANFGLTPEALARSAGRLRRARAALDEAAAAFLARHAETSEAGYTVIDQAALQAAPEEIALRALARTIGAVGGGVELIQLAKLEALYAALKATPDKAHTLARCRIAPRAGRLTIVREIRSEGLPVLALRPGERSLWDNRFAVTLGAKELRPVTVRALGEAGVKLLKEREALPPSLPRPAARALPSCWRGETLLGLPDFRQLGGDLRQPEPGKAPSWRHEAGLNCKATFLGGRAEGTLL